VTDPAMDMAGIPVTGNEKLLVALMAMGVTIVRVYLTRALLAWMRKERKSVTDTSAGYGPGGSLNRL
jgi:hypothetical protein